MDPRTHRADRDPKSRRDFLVCELPEREEQEGLAVVVRQSEEGCDQPRLHPLGVESRDVVDRFLRSFAEHLPESPEVLAFLAQVMTDDVGGDPKQPWPGRSV